jgi:type IV pilus assembly protein PilO
MKQIVAVRTHFSDSIRELKTFDWNDISDPESIGVWPGAVKLVLLIILFAACLGAGYWFFIKTRQEELARVAAAELTLRADLESKAVLAANLQSYRAQMVAMNETFGALLSQLPSQTEVPGLLDDISFTGFGTGLELNTIQLQPERAQEFYIELPINIIATGNYHDFGAFVSGVASLSRIVTLHDFNITAGANRNELTMRISARTYRYNASGTRAPAGVRR